MLCNYVRNGVTFSRGWVTMTYGETNAPYFHWDIDSLINSFCDSWSFFGIVLFCILFLLLQEDLMF